jgi:Rrf2 family nitric oxide-sensitive transcriptional repressor
MHLTVHTDYALRVLVYLAIHPGETVSASFIAAEYGISRHHVAKVAKELVREGLVEGFRGSRGGLRLARKGSQTTVGDVARKFEGFPLVECFRNDGACSLAPACQLAGLFDRALGAFMEVLDATTIADLATNGHRLVIAPRAQVPVVDTTGTQPRSRLGSAVT